MLSQIEEKNEGSHQTIVVWGPFTPISLSSTATLQRRLWGVSSKHTALQASRGPPQSPKPTKKQKHSPQLFVLKWVHNIGWSFFPHFYLPHKCFFFLSLLSLCLHYPFLLYPAVALSCLYPCSELRRSSLNLIGVEVLPSAIHYRGEVRQCCVLFIFQLLSPLIPSIFRLSHSNISSIFFAILIIFPLHLHPSRWYTITLVFWS